MVLGFNIEEWFWIILSFEKMNNILAALSYILTNIHFGKNWNWWLHFRHFSSLWILKLIFLSLAWLLYKKGLMKNCPYVVIDLWYKISDKCYKDCKLGKPGGLDLSGRDLDRDSRSRHFKKSILTVEIFSTVKKSRSWWSRFSGHFEKWHLDKSRQSLRPKVSIFKMSRSRLSIKTFPKACLDTLKNNISTCVDCRDLQA